VGFAGVLFLALLAAPDPETVKEAARKVYQEGRYQSELPSDRPALDDPDEVNYDPDEHESRRERSRPIIRQVDGEAIGQAILWVFGIVIGALILFWGFTALNERRRATAARPRAPVPVRKTQVLPSPIPDAERLAETGDYAAALHSILLSALARHSNLISPAWTARHAARSLGNESLSSLVTMVEITLFGGRNAERTDYERARTLFEQTTEVATQ